MKEAHPKNIRFLLLTVLILSSSAFQVQAYYHPDEGRWISRDPIEERGGPNLYGFAWNAPLIWVDSNGGIPSKYPRHSDTGKPVDDKDQDPSDTGVLRCVYRPAKDSSADQGHTWLEWPKTGTILIKNPCSGGYNWLNCGRFCCPDPMEKARGSEVTCTHQLLDTNEYDHGKFSSCLVNRASEHQKQQQAPGFIGKCSEYADYLLKICRGEAKKDKENTE